MVQQTTNHPIEPEPRVRGFKMAPTIMILDLFCTQHIQVQNTSRFQNKCLHPIACMIELSGARRRHVRCRLFAPWWYHTFGLLSLSFK